MQLSALPVCFFPTTVLLVDDNRRFLVNVQMDLHTESAVYRTFDNPKRVLEYLTQEYSPDYFTKRCLLRPEEEHGDHRNIDVDIRAIHKEIFNSRRFEQISVMIVDYSMPGMTGLELCQQIKGPIKKILLTGDADEQLATEAFNKGLIDQFVRKDARDFEQRINAAIKELQYQYFAGLSSIIVDSLTKDPEHPPMCLDDPGFIEFFLKLIKKHKVAEYYLMDAVGSYLFLDATAKPSWLAVKTEEDFHGWAETAVYADAPDKIISVLKARSKIPYFHTDSDFDTPPSQWGPFLHTAQKLVGREAYYYAYISKSTAYDVGSDAVLSYKAYSNKLSVS